jgi:hypothetical protein
MGGGGKRRVRERETFKKQKWERQRESMGKEDFRKIKRMGEGE